MAEPKQILPARFAIMGQPLPTDVESLANAGYKTLISNRPDREGKDQPSSMDMRKEAGRFGMQYLYIPVTEQTIKREDVTEFGRALDNAPQPVVAHCGTGKRAFLLWALSEVLDKNRSLDEVMAVAKQHGIDASSLQQLVARLRD